MADRDQDEGDPESDTWPVKRPLGDSLERAVTEGKMPQLDLGAAMEAAGGEVAARWRASGASQEAWRRYGQAEEAYWETEAWAHLKLHTVAILQIAETTLRKTTLTDEHRALGWSQPLVDLLASMCAEFRHQFESDTFSDPRAGYKLARAKLEELSPQWPDLDDLSVAVDLARRALDVASHRLGLHGDDGA